MKIIKLFLKLSYVIQCIILISTLLMSANLYAQTPEVSIVKNTFIFDTAAFKSCHASTIVQLANRKLMAAWFGGAYEGSPDVSIWTSVRNDSGWTQPEKTADGVQQDGKQFACWNPVLFKVKEGTLYLHYKVGPNPREWWAMYKTSVDDGNT